MKKILYISAIALVFGACNKSATTTAEDAGQAATSNAESTTYNVSTSESTVSWKGSKISGDSHSGTVAIKNGEISVEGNQVTAGNFVLDMGNLTSTDGMDEKSTVGLLGHLQNEDFFDVAKHPTASFEVVSSTDTELTGNLTIKGISKSITIPYFFQEDNGVAMIKSTFSFDRTEWDVKHNSAKFFDNLKDKVINDAIEMKVDLKASK